jgi:hypothetical protein
VVAPLLMTQRAVPHLAAGSSIVFVGSTTATVGFPGCSAYTATKGAVASGTSVTRSDGTVVLEGEAVCYTMPFRPAGDARPLRLAPRSSVESTERCRVIEEERDRWRHRPGLFPSSGLPDPASPRQVPLIAKRPTLRIIM